MKKLIKEKTDYLADMLAGMKIANDDIDIIADTVVVRKNKKMKELLLFQAVVVDMNQHMQVTLQTVC